MPTDGAMKDEIKEIMDVIFTSQFSKFVEQYYDDFCRGNKKKDFDVFVTDILDFMKQHKTENEDNIVTLCLAIIILVGKQKQKQESFFGRR